MLMDIKLASEKRSEELLEEDIDRRLDLLLANYQKVTANPRSMGYLRFLLRHYAKSPTPWRDCVKDNTRRVGPERVKGLCLSYDTPISTSNGIRYISELKSGDEVWSYDGKDFVLSEVLWSGCTGKNLEVCRVEVEDDMEIFVTPDHQLLKYNEEWVESNKLNAGDFLLGPLTLSDFSSALASAFLTVPMSFSNSYFSDSKITFPRMSSWTTDIPFSLTSLDSLVIDDYFFDLLPPPGRHPGIDYASYCDGHIPMYPPIESFLSSQIERSNTADSKNSFETIKRLDKVLTSSYESDRLSIGLRVPAETSLALQETSSPSNICGREVTDVVLSKKSMDVWDIVVADTHNFVVHDFIIAHNCGVLKDAIRQTTYWRGKKGHSKVPDVGAPGVAIAYGDQGAANPPWHGSNLSELDMGIMAVPEEICLIMEDLGKQCDPYRVLIGLDSAPYPSSELESLIL